MIGPEHFLPVHFKECHARLIQAEPQFCLDAAAMFRAEDDPLIQFCLGLRDLPGRLRRGQEAHRFSMNSFTSLGREGERRLWLGLMGSFWRWDYGLLPHETTKAEFWKQDANACRLLLVFETERVAAHRTRLVTRTLVSCPQPELRRRMTPYWYGIRPVSGLIRRRMLSAIEKKAVALQNRSFTF